MKKPRKFGRFVGVVPFEYQNGTSIVSKSRVSKNADKDFKMVLPMATMRAVRLKDNDFEKFLLLSGKVKKWYDSLPPRETVVRVPIHGWSDGSYGQMNRMSVRLYASPFGHLKYS